MDHVCAQVSTLGTIQIMGLSRKDFDRFPGGNEHTLDLTERVCYVKSILFGSVEHSVRLDVFTDEPETPAEVNGEGGAA